MRFIPTVYSQAGGSLPRTDARAKADYRELLRLALTTAITIGASFSLGKLPGLGYPLMIVGFTCMGWFGRGVYQAQKIDTRFHPNDTRTHSVTIGATKDGMSRH